MGEGILRSFGKLKTVNGNSLHGTGDVSVVAGPHTHVESDIIDLDKYTQAEVDNLLLAKQNTLISGTNIKTINGNSLLGSGDIVLSSSMNIDGGNATSIGILMGIDGGGA